MRNELKKKIQGRERQGDGVYPLFYLHHIKCTHPFILVESRAHLASFAALDAVEAAFAGFIDDEAAAQGGHAKPNALVRAIVWL